MTAIHAPMMPRVTMFWTVTLAHAQQDSPEANAKQVRVHYVLIPVESKSALCFKFRKQDIMQFTTRFMFLIIIVSFEASKD